MANHHHHCAVQAKLQPLALFHARKLFPRLDEQLGPFEPEFDHVSRPAKYTYRMRECTFDLVISSPSASVPVASLIECSVPECRHQVVVLAVLLEEAAWTTTPQSSGLLTIHTKKKGLPLIGHRHIRPVSSEKKEEVAQKWSCDQAYQFQFGLDSTQFEFHEPLYLTNEDLLSSSLLERQRCVGHAMDRPEDHVLFDEDVNKPIPNVLSHVMHNYKLQLSANDQVTTNDPENQRKVANHLHKNLTDYSPWSLYALDSDDALEAELLASKSLPSRMMIRLRFIYLIL